MFQAAAREIVFEIPADMFRQALALVPQLLHQGRIVCFNNLVEQCLLGSVAFVGDVTNGILAIRQHTGRASLRSVRAVCNVDGPTLCRMFNHATSGQGWPNYLSSDNDPLFQYHRWKANLRVLEVEEIKSLPNVPMSHPFVERLIGSIRRELLDQTLFWTATELEKKLRDYQRYYNECRAHTGRDGATPVERNDSTVVNISQYRWEKHCRGLFQLPVAA